MSSAEINDLLVLRLDTTSGEASASATLPRECVLVQVFAQGADPVVSAAASIYRVRAGQPDVLIGETVIPRSDFPNDLTEIVPILNVANADATTFLRGDKLKVVKSAGGEGAIGRLFFQFQAPGAPLFTSSV